MEKPVGVKKNGRMWKKSSYVKMEMELEKVECIGNNSIKSSEVISCTSEVGVILILHGLFQ